MDGPNDKDTRALGKKIRGNIAILNSVRAPLLPSLVISPASDG